MFSKLNNCVVIASLEKNHPHIEAKECFHWPWNIRWILLLKFVSLKDSRLIDLKIIELRKNCVFNFYKFHLLNVLHTCAPMLCASRLVLDALGCVIVLNKKYNDKRAKPRFCLFVLDERTLFDTVACVSLKKKFDIFALQER